MVIVEVRQVGDKIWSVTTHHVADEDGDPEIQRVVDESAAEDFRLIEVRDVLQTLLARSQLETREREVILLFLQGWDFTDIAQRLHISRQAANDAFWRAVQRFREVAAALGITEP